MKMSQTYSKLNQSENYNKKYGQDDNFNQSQAMNSMKYDMGASSSAFPLKRLNQKFQWKQLMKLNTNYIQSSGDASSLEPFIENLLSSSISEEELQILPEGYVITLIKLLQLVGENLINIQQRLEYDNKSIEMRAMQMSQSYPNKTSSQDYTRIIKKLKQEIKEKDILIQLHQKIIQSNKGVNDDDYNDGQIDDNVGRQRFFCQFCSGKKFSSEENLEDHMRRRHLIESEVIPKKGKGENINSKLNEMKTHFDSLIRNSQMQNEYQRLNDKLNTIENAVIGNNADMMNSYNMTLNEMKMNQSRMNNLQQGNTQRQSRIEPLSRTYLINPNNDSSNMLRDTMNNINDKIEKNNKDNNDKFQNLFEEMKKMKMSVSSDISHLKQKQSYNRESVRMNTSPSKNAQFDNPQSQNITFTKSKDINTNDNNRNRDHLRANSQPKVYVNTSNNNTPTPQPQNQDNSNSNKAKLTAPSMQQNTSNLSIITKKRENEKQRQVKSSKPIDSELDIFYKKFNERDNEFQHGTISTYTKQLIQSDFVKNKNINKIIDSYIQKRLFVMGNNQKISLNTLSKDDLMQLINNCCQDLSEKGMEVDNNNNPSFYGYYKQSIDFLLQIEQTVEIGHNVFIDSKEDEKRRMENERIQASILTQNRSNINFGIRLDQEKEGNEDSQYGDNPRFNIKE